MSAPKIRVLIAEDSPTARTLLIDMFKRAGDFEIVGIAVDGLEAVERTRTFRPDVVTMDIQMPGMDGLEATRRIMSEHPTPIVIVSSLDVGSVEVSMEALRTGALAVLEKPVGPGAPTWESSRNTLLSTVRSMSQVKLVRRWGSVPPYRSNVPDPIPATERSGEPRTLTTPTASPASLVPIKAIGIAASTGGPAAYHKILSGLDADYPIPILIVQHIAHGFGDGFARWLANACTVRVKIAERGETLRPATVYVAPDDLHLGVTANGRVELSSEKPRSGFRPSASYLFESLAEALGAQAAGVILTGMGSDGVDGLSILKRCGGRVIAQDEGTSDIYGMPAAAAKAGIVDIVASLSDIPGHLERLAGRRKTPVV